MDFYNYNSHPSQLQSSKFAGSEGSSQFHATMGAHSNQLLRSQVFSGSPWGSCGYVDEPPLMEGKPIIILHQR
jgi:hypothetical protein